jgi:hypothetical protein
MTASRMTMTIFLRTFVLLGGLPSSRAVML